MRTKTARLIARRLPRVDVTDVAAVSTAGTRDSGFAISSVPLPGPPLGPSGHSEGTARSTEAAGPLLTNQENGEKAFPYFRGLRTVLRAGDALIGDWF